MPEPPKIGSTKLVGLAARKAALTNEAALTTTTKPVNAITITPAEAKDRIGIVFDDSGSMGYNLLKDAKAGCEEFLRSCKPNETAVAIYPMNAKPLLLSTDLPALALLIQSIHSTGSTPLLETLKKMIEANQSNPKLALTRAIVFSDGSPNVGFPGGYLSGNAEHIYDEKNTHPYTTTIALCKELKLSVDTVFIGDKNNETAITFMKTLATDTGGIFLHFDPSKSNFRTAFKYLSPSNRLMLADKSFVQKLERGEL